MGGPYPAGHKALALGHPKERGGRDTNWEPAVRLAKGLVGWGVFFPEFPEDSLLGRQGWGGAGQEG